MNIGYHRLSKSGNTQNLDLQHDALTKGDVDRKAIYEDRVSGRKDTVFVRPKDLREAAGLQPAELAERLGMGVGDYLAWEGDTVRVRDELMFREEAGRAPSPAELLRLLIEAKRWGLGAANFA